MGLGDDGSRAHLSQERQGAPCCRNTLREGRVGTGREERLEHWPGCGVSSLSEQWAAGGGFRPRGAMHECFCSGKIPSVRVRNALEGPRASQERLLQEAA